MNDNPRVSVVVLNYRRLHELKVCLKSILRQDYSNVEAIVVDNHSEEDVAAMIHSLEAPSVRLIELPANLGCCGGRNAGLREAGGEIIITLDNDVSFRSDHEIHNVVSAFRENPHAHVLAFRICDAHTGALRVREWCHPRDWTQFSDTEFETDFFGEGASAYRREVFDEVGHYWEPLFIGHEGHDLALRIINHGCRVLYCPRVSVVHSMSKEARPFDRPFYYYTRNYIWIAYKNYNLAQGSQYLLPKLMMMLAFSLRAGRPALFFKGVRDGVTGLRQIRPRTPLNRQAIAYVNALQKHRPSWAQRLWRHKVETQI